MIKLIQHQDPHAIKAAREDFASITMQPLVEHPYWFLDTNTCREYHGIYGAIGWPQKVSDHSDGKPGYACIVGVVKTSREPKESPFLILEEIEERSIDILLSECSELRKRWGYGEHKSILPVWVGDYLRYESVVSDFNVRTNEKEPIILIPPDDHDNPQLFEICLRRLQFVLSAKAPRLSLGTQGIARARMEIFTRDDPVITALGGLIHTLLLRTPWMDQRGSVFEVDI